jgi:hypothetical protein
MLFPPWRTYGATIAQRRRDRNPTSPPAAEPPEGRDARKLVLGSMTLTATVCFDAVSSPAEVFLSGEDASVVISVALQYGISARSLGKSIARIPENLDGPPIKPASPIGAALDLLVDYEASQNG